MIEPKLKLEILPEYSKEERLSKIEEFVKQCRENNWQYYTNSQAYFYLQFQYLNDNGLAFSLENDKKSRVYLKEQGIGLFYIAFQADQYYDNKTDEIKQVENNNQNLVNADEE